jgi:cyclopropane fatty-acyl-phospholipid synthase-like methyltransferase
VGAMAGRIMAARKSNRIRNYKTVEIMELRPESRVLEIGCGPGLALARCASIVTTGCLVGLDHSGLMIRLARKRLQRQGVADRVELVEGGVERLSDWPGTFDRILSLNVIQFQNDKLVYFRAVHDALETGGFV